LGVLLAIGQPPSRYRGLGNTVALVRYDSAWELIELVRQGMEFNDNGIAAEHVLEQNGTRVTRGLPRAER